MDNADTFAVFPATPPVPCSGANENDVVSRRSVGATRLGIRKNAVVAKGEPPGSPALAVISPLVENTSHASAGADVRSSGNDVRSTTGDIHSRTSSQKGRHRRSFPDHWPLQCYAAQRVHYLYPHFVIAFVTILDL